MVMLFIRKSIKMTIRLGSSTYTTSTTEAREKQEIKAAVYCKRLESCIEVQ